MDNKLILPGDVGQVSDGYHTFYELYDHRSLLWINLLNRNHENAFKTRLDDKGVGLTGWFIAGMNTEHGQITYHLRDSFWEYLEVKQKLKNDDYDGHDSHTVLQRLVGLALKQRDENRKNNS